MPSKTKSKRNIFPKKIILMITTHGEIPAPDSIPNTFEIPEGIKLVKLNVASLGECNLLNEETSKAHFTPLKI